MTRSQHAFQNTNSTPKFQGQFPQVLEPMMLQAVLHFHQQHSLPITIGTGSPIRL